MNVRNIAFFVLLVSVHSIPEKGDLKDLIASVYKNEESVQPEPFISEGPQQNSGSQQSANGNLVSSNFENGPQQNNHQTPSKWNGTVDDLLSTVFGNIPVSTKNEKLSQVPDNIGNTGSVEPKDDEDLFASIFGNGATTQAPPPPPTNYPNGIIPGLPEATGCNPGSECVPHYLCKENKIIKDGTGLIDIRFDGETPKECANYLDVCCSIEDKVEQPIIHPQSQQQGCGIRNADGIGFRITGDNNETEYGEFPWMVAIFRESYRYNGYIQYCSGSLIHPWIVLTAAHCVYGRSPRSLGARAGEWDTKTTNEIFPHQDRTVVGIIIHQNFRRHSLYNDIALLILEKPFELTDNVRTICLPPVNMKFDGAKCIATGWERDFYGQSGRYQDILKKTDLQIVEKNTCKNLLWGSVFRRDFKLHRSFICAGGEGVGKNTCLFDGGSPVVCPIPGAREQYYQSGMVIRPIGRSQDTPGLYVNIAKLRSWIDEQLAYRNIDGTHYTP